MKVLFIYTNINGSYEDCYSIGLASIVSAARQDGHQCQVIIVHEKGDYQSVLAAVAQFQPKIVGFSSVSSQFSFVRQIAELIKTQFPEIITVCGGVHPTISPNCLRETNDLDGIFIGESDLSFVEFLRKIEHGESYQDTDNFAYLYNREIKINRLKPFIHNLDSLPYPDKEIYPFKDIAKVLNYVPFFFSRGCPYLCTYCSNHAIAKAYGLVTSPTRYRSPESSICEIEETIQKFPGRWILIGDDIFGLDKKWREEFCRKYKERIGIKFVCLLRANIVDEIFVRQLKEAGCYRVSFGVESGSEYIRNKVMKRYMSNAQIIKAFDLVREHGLETNAINIIGTPGETEEMIWETIKLNRRIKPAYSGVNIFYPYKGTQLGDYCFENSLVNEKLYQDFSNERRETVLNFPESYKKKLVYYRNYWEALVYPHDLKKHVLRFARKTSAWKYLRTVKRSVLFFLSQWRQHKIPDRHPIP